MSHCDFLVAVGSLLLLIADSAISGEPTQQLQVSTSFAGGSAEVKSIDADAGVIHISPKVHPGHGWPCWWYLRIDGLQKGQPLSLKVSKNTKPFRASQILSASWAQPHRAAVSTDNVTWTHTPRHRRENGVAVYEFEASAETIWLAWGPPFLPSHAEAFLENIAQSLPDSERFDLARTRHDRAVQGIRIGSGSYGVWVQARQHAWEAGSSWVGRGFIEWAASDDPAAAELRKIATIHFIPIMDIDNVAIGAGGKDAIPRDHNRDWSDEPTYPEVAAAQAKIQMFDKAHRFDLFLDLHNPGANEERPYFFGPLNLNELPSIQQRNHARWLAITRESISDPLPLESDYKFATYVKTEEERNRMSSNWVRNHTADHVLSTTLETVWNTPQSTQEGYQAVGRQLAQSVARYLSNNPRK